MSSQNPIEKKAASYTPGPWAVATGEPFKVVTVSGVDYAPFPVIDSDDPEELKANARLIAAAPELLEALVNLSTAADTYKQSHATDCDCEFCDSINKADAAIAKAVRS